MCLQTRNAGLRDALSLQPQWGRQAEGIGLFELFGLRLPLPVLAGLVVTMAVDGGEGELSPWSDFSGELQPIHSAAVSARP